jgi:hypothetical protein
LPMKTFWEWAAEFHMELNPNKIRAFKSLDNIVVLRMRRDGILE